MYGVKFLKQLESIINRCLYPPLGHDYPMTIVQRATFLWYEIAIHQAFHNGNKRTALFAALTTLESNGYRFALSESEMYDVSVAIAEHRMNSEDLYHLMLKHTTIQIEAEELMI